MSAMDTLLGKPGEQPQCKVFGPKLAVHWYPSMKKGTACFCGATTRGTKEAAPSGAAPGATE